MSHAHSRSVTTALLMLLLVAVVSSTPSSPSPVEPPVAQPTTLEPSPTSLPTADVANSSESSSLLRLSSEVYSWQEFSYLDVFESSATLVIAVQEYGARGFPELVQRLSFLQEESQKTMLKGIEIILVHFGDSEALQYDVIDKVSQLFNENIKFIPPSPKQSHTNLGDAFNNAAKKARGSFLIFATDTLQDLSAASIVQMARVLKHPDVAMVAPKIVDGHTGGSTIFSTGVTFVQGKNPHKSTWSSWSETNAATSQTLTSRSDVPYLLHRYQGHLSTDSRVQETREVFGVSKYCFAISKANFNVVNGFDPTFRNSYLDVDLSMRLKKTSGGKMTLYVPHIVVGVVGQHRPEDDILNGDFSQNDQVRADNKIFLERWVEQLAPELTRNVKLTSTSLSWSMDCGMGNILGFTTEAVNLIMVLHEQIRMKVINDAAKCKSEMTKIGFPASTIKTIDILAHKDDRGITGQHLAVVMHKDPGRYDATYTFNPPELLVGRSMFETNSIPQPWVSHTVAVDFVWVPSEFNRQSFTTGGVNTSKLEVLSESIDLLHFDPATTSHKPYSSSSFQSTGLTSPDTLPNPAKFNFLSVFKWESRKNWKTLIEAFYEEFSSAEDVKDVKLYIRSSMDPNNEHELEQWRTAYLTSKQKTAADLPQIEFLNRFVPYSKLPKLYKGASAYVTATHGEGWGLPIMEAMSMGLPVIATNWSGITQFTTPETALLLEATLEPTNNPDQQGHQWAKVSISDLRTAMRSLVNDPKLCTSLGKKARKHLLDQFSADKVAGEVIALLRTHEPGFEHFKAYRRSSPSTSTYGARYGNTNYGATTGTTTNTWSNSNVGKPGLEKMGIPLTRGRLSE